jgi:hypothetical protein
MAGCVGGNPSLKQKLSVYVLFYIHLVIAQLVCFVGPKGRVELAHDTTCLPLHRIQSSGFPRHALLSSQLLGLTNASTVFHSPAHHDHILLLTDNNLLDPKASRTFVTITGVVAAHAFDLRAEKKVYVLPDASRCGEITD